MQKKTTCLRSHLLKSILLYVRSLLLDIRSLFPDIMSLLPVSVSRVCKECAKCVAKSENRGSEGPQSEQKQEEEEALCRNAGLVYSFALFELNPPTKTLHYSRISTSLPTTIHLASPSTMIQLNP